MKFAGELPMQWRITLKSGKILGLWASSYSEVGDYYVFDLLVDATEEERKDDHLVITARFPNNDERVIVTVAMVPVSVVDEVQTGKWDLGASS